MPQWARDLPDTDQRLHDFIVDVLRRLQHRLPDEPSALHAHLRTEVKRRIRDQLRHDERRHARGARHNARRGQMASTLENSVGTATLQRYEAALAALDPTAREAIIARVEWGFDDEELALALDQPDAAAARLVVRKATFELAQALRRVVRADRR